MRSKRPPVYEEHNYIWSLPLLMLGQFSFLQFSDKGYKYLGNLLVSDVMYQCFFCIAVSPRFLCVHFLWYKEEVIS